MEHRVERDSLGELEVPGDAYYGVPTATRIALLLGTRPLVKAAYELAESCARKAGAFASVLKTGRTHLQDAVPMTLGQEFGGYAACIRRGAEDVAAASTQLQELNV